jgi:sugar phosphate isomerase/epimerase
VFSFWRAKPANELFERAVEHLAKSVQVAAAADCVLLLENVGGCVAETAAEAARFLSAIPSPHFGLVWDPNNAYCAGEHPFPEGYEKLDKRRVYHIHLRDARRNTQTGRCDWLPVGKGEIDNLGQLRALAEDKFQGTVSLETHYQRPDKNKELASRESLKGLLGLLEQV